VAALPHESAGRARFGLIVSILALIQPLLLVLYVSGSFIFTGGQVLPDSVPFYDQVYGFPVFPVPAWLVFALAALLLAGVIVLVATSQVLDAPRLTGLFGPAIASAVATVLFLLTRTDGAAPGYLIALVLNVVSLVVVLACALRFVSRYDRMRRAGELPNGYP